MKTPKILKYFNAVINNC